MGKPLYAGLEIGSTRTIVAVGVEDESTRRLKLVGLGEYPTIGVRKGQIVDMENAVKSVTSAIKLAEKNADVSIWQLVVACSGGHIQTRREQGVVSIRSQDRKITKEDIEEVNEIARDVRVPEDCQILHTIPQSYQLDNQPGILRPENMCCDVLKMEMLAILGKNNQIENIRNAAQDVEADVSDVVFSGLCPELSVLTGEQKKNGVALIDLGGGTTDYLAYANRVISSAGSIAVGGDHVTNDISIAFDIPFSKAEELKREVGGLIVTEDPDMRRIIVKGDLGLNDKEISRHALQTVVDARMDELFRLVRSRLDADDVLQNLSSIVLTGGGAYLKGVLPLASRVFGLPCSIGNVTQVDGFEKYEQPASYATAAGLLLYAQKSGSQSMGLISGFFKRLFNRGGAE